MHIAHLFQLSALIICTGSASVVVMALPSGFVHSSASDEYDVIVIGGGVVGCAILYQLTHFGYRCLLVEKENALLSGASSGNSGMVHSGFDVTPGTIESQCMTITSELETFCSNFRIPYKKIGAIMIAKNEEELLGLDEVENKSQLNGIFNLKRLSKEEVLRMEPNLNQDAVFGGLLIPDEAVIDSWLFPVILAHHARKNGAKIKVGCEILSGKQMTNKLWSLDSTHGILKAGAVVNAAGLFGDLVEEICQSSAFHIYPRKGQFVVYDHEAGHLINHVILPVPTERSKGVLIYPSVHGNLVVGPTADDCTERSNPILSESVKKMLIEHGENMIPSLARFKIVQTFAGIRPATEKKDYQLGCNADRRWVTVGGIRSTGVTCCLAIAKHVYQLIKDKLNIVPSSVTLPQEQRSEIGRESVQWTTRSPDDCEVTLDGIRYSVTHPLTRLGLRYRCNL